MTQLIYKNDVEYKLQKQQYIKDILKPIVNHIDFHWIGEKSRRKITFQIDNSNNLGFYYPKTHDLMKIDNYEVAEQEINDLILPLKKLLKNIENNLFNQLTIIKFDNGLSLIWKCKRKLMLINEIKLIEFAKKYNLNCNIENDKQIIPLLTVRKNQIYCNKIKLNVLDNIFLQPTKAGLDFIINFLKSEIIDKPFKKIADIYSGIGIYSFSLIDLVNAQFFCYEGNKDMIEIIKNNLKEYNLNHKIKAFERDLIFDPISAKEINCFDNIIINPPRNGCEPIILNIVKSNIKHLQYISCNPKTFVRDAKILIDNNFKINRIIAVDQFYHSDHCEILSSFTKNNINN